MTKKSQTYVGTFPLGFMNVELYAITDETNGYFFTRPDDKSPGRIKVGIDTEHWDQVVAILLHETFEMVCSHMNLRYEVSGAVGDASSYTFIFNHTQFCDACDRQARFITPALPKLAAVWQKLQAAKEKTK